MSTNESNRTMPNRETQRIWTFLKPIEEKDLVYGTKIVYQVERQFFRIHGQPSPITVYTVILEFRECYIKHCKESRQHLLSRRLRNFIVTDQIKDIAEDGKIKVGKTQIFFDLYYGKYLPGKVITREGVTSF